LGLFTSFPRRRESIAEALVNEDDIRRKIGVDRGALIKVWLHERVQQEKALRKTG
jgi:hypothetical protein